MQVARDLPDPLSATFFALADPTRRAILARLVKGEASVQELSAPFSMSQPAISKHLKVLERAGLVSSQAEAQRRPRRIEAAPLANAVEWLERYRQLWERNYQQLDALLAEMQAVAPEPSKSRTRRTLRRHRSVPRKRRST
jgi:DNA-binding transcriptional ArsR family regulator